ncbi:MAG: hypothetical protein FJZ88_05460 [Chloroflexi bacterium]|nr:hypothetical protein [Chloroflexota bacterium]
MVEGVVKTRDDRVTINCYRAKQYKPEETSTEAGTQPRPQAQPQPPPKPPVRRKLVITMNQTDSTNKDLKLLSQVKDTLSRYPGNDTVQLIIITAEETTTLALPQKSNYCLELAQEICNMLGDNSLKLLETK